jgi:hypothetical protein
MLKSSVENIYAGARRTFREAMPHSMDPRYRERRFIVAEFPLGNPVPEKNIEGMPFS